MPRNVRNFWLMLDIDGRHTVVETGPPAASGGFRMRILTRAGVGKISAKRYTLRGRVESNGSLWLDLTDDNEEILYRKEVGHR